MANGSLALFLLRHRHAMNKNKNKNNDNNKNDKIEIYLNDVLYYKGSAKNYKPLDSEVGRDIYTFSTTEKIENDDNTIYLKYNPDEIGAISYNVYSYKTSNRAKYKQCDFVIKKCNKCKECQLYMKYKQCIDTGRHTPSCPNSDSYFEGIRKTSDVNYNSLLNYYTQRQNEIDITTSHNHFWKVGNKYYFNLPYLTLYKNKVNGELSYYISPFKNDSDDWEIVTSLLGNDIFVVDDKEELINKYWPMIINADPKDMFEMQTINKYKDEVLPRLILDINILDTELAKKLKINDGDKLNYVGKFARLKTLNKNIECYTYDNKGNRDLHLKWDGEYVTLLNPDQLLFLSKYAIGQFVDGECRFIPNNNLVVKIEHNSWVNENTIII